MTVAFPVDIVLRYEGRGPERVTWDGQGTWKELTRTGPHRLMSAHIDPEHRVALEVSRLNSARRTDPSARVATHLERTVDVLGRRTCWPESGCDTDPRAIAAPSAVMRRGFRVASGRPGLVTAIWCWHLVLGFALALPMFRWLQAATAYRPEADAFAERFSLAGSSTCCSSTAPRSCGSIQAAVWGGVLVAVLASPLLIAATLASVRDASRDRRALAAAAATLYLPFLLLIIIGRGIALAAAGLTAVLAGLALAPLSQSAWEPGYLWAAAIQAVTAVLVARPAACGR